MRLISRATAAFSGLLSFLPFFPFCTLSSIIHVMGQRQFQACDLIFSHRTQRERIVTFLSVFLFLPPYSSLFRIFPSTSTQCLSRSFYVSCHFLSVYTFPHLSPHHLSVFRLFLSIFIYSLSLGQYIQT